MYCTYMRRAAMLAAVLVCGLLGCNREGTSGAPGSGTGTATGSAGLLAAPTAVASVVKGPVEVVTLPDVFIAEVGSTTLHVAWKIPAGTGINDEAPFHVRWTTSVGLAEVPPEAKSKGADVRAGFDITVAPLAGEPAAHLGGTLNVVVCDSETHKVCLPVQRRIEVTFSVQKGGKQKVFAEVPLPAARPQG